MSMCLVDLERCECSCHRDGSLHTNACCYTCLRCRTDRIKPIAFGDGDLCRRCERFDKMTDEELQRVVGGKTVGESITAEIELLRRQRERL